ncbi:MAG TPA: YgiT-type zinc finger protein [Spirochaetota bacterium]|nr:YgiT-type zinc finger protein [Spirochaetota bacterium]HQE58566.1 YgiT-type zinc finger protein [Spirochaetota bacterium]
MECSCGGAVTEGKSSYRVSEDNFCFILDNIPAYKCTRCGKILFSDETVEKIQKLVGRIKRDSSEIVSGRPSVNLYNY